MADINPAIPMSMNYGTSPFIQSADIRKSLAAADSANLDTAIKLEDKKKYNTAQNIIKRHLKKDGSLDPIGAMKELYSFSPQHADMFAKDYAEHMGNELKGMQQSEYVKLHPTAAKLLEETVAEKNWPGRPVQGQGQPPMQGQEQAPMQQEQAPVQEQQPYIYQPQQTPQQNAVAYGNAAPDSSLAREQAVTESMGMDPSQIKNLQQQLGVPADGIMGPVTMAAMQKQQQAATQAVPTQLPETSTLGKMVSSEVSTKVPAQAEAEVIPPKPTTKRLTTDLSGIISGNVDPSTAAPKQRDYIDRWLEYTINPAREALGNVEPALSVKDNASALYKAQAAANTKPSLTANQKLKYAEWTENQWQKFYKDTTPLNGSSRNALGIAGISNVRAQRAIQMLSDPSVVLDPQMFSLAMDDLMYIFRGGVPTEHSQEAATYKNAMTWWSNFKQKLFAQPEILNSPGNITNIRNVLNSILEVDNKVIDRNLGHARVAYQRIIDDDQEANGGARAEAFFGGLLGTKDLSTAPVASPEQRHTPSQTGYLDEIKAVALNPNTSDAERIKAERILDKHKVEFRSLRGK